MKKSTLSIGALLIAVSASFSQVYSQSGDGYPEALLNTKRVFSRGLADAIGQPFRGVATSDRCGKRPFSIEIYRRIYGNDRLRSFDISRHPE